MGGHVAPIGGSRRQQTDFVLALEATGIQTTIDRNSGWGS
jgi:hypothetical protein